MNAWLLHGPPPPGEFVVFGFPCAGTGAATSYRDWPRTLASGVLCPVQPPGRETRIAEPPAADLTAFADSLVDALAPHLDRPYAFAGHCAAYAAMTRTARTAVDRGLPPPARLFASSWGAPQCGPFGRVELLGLDPAAVAAEVDAISVARTGAPLVAELRELAAEALTTDLRLLRGYRHDETRPQPAPTVVIGWADDDVVPPSVVWPSGWSAHPGTVYHLLPGDHWAFLDCPPALADLVVAEMTAAVRA